MNKQKRKILICGNLVKYKLSAIQPRAMSVLLPLVNFFVQEHKKEPFYQRPLKNFF
jgi:hypothetical protein